MKPIERALLDQCVTNCTLEIHKTLKMFSVKNPNLLDKVLIQHDIEQVILNCLPELKDAN